MQQLGVVPRLYPDIESGSKTSTIRWRETRIAPGYMRYVCDGEPWRNILVWVTRCTDMPLAQAAAFLGRRDEWTDDVMLSGMREHYPQIELSDLVQVIEHMTPLDTRQRLDYPG